MATFTVTLKDAIDIMPDIGLNDYPIFNETYRIPLNQKIKDHFWNREIGQETIEMFRLALRRKMNEIMPLYNQHYLASQLTFDPLSTVDIHTLTDTGATIDNTGHSESGSTSNAKSRVVASDFPQTQLAGNQDYASSAQDSVSDTGADSTADENSNSTQTGNSDSRTTGYQGHAPMLIMQYRQTLVNIDMMVIGELENLFMLVWSNGDEFTEGANYYGYNNGFCF